MFDVIVRAYLAALMPDFRYRQTTAALDVRGHPFRGTGCQPIELGWRVAFPDWRPAEEQGKDGQALPPLRHGEPALLTEAAVEDETRPPPRYSEGTLVEALQNAWRVVEDEVLQAQLREAKGIGTPATRAEIIRGLKVQDLLTADGKHVAPTVRSRAVRRAGAGQPGAGRLRRDGAARVPARRSAGGSAGHGGRDRRRMRPGEPDHRPADRAGRGGS